MNFGPFPDELPYVEHDTRYTFLRAPHMVTTYQFLLAGVLERWAVLKYSIITYYFQGTRDTIGLACSVQLGVGTTLATN